MFFVLLCFMTSSCSLNSNSFCGDLFADCQKCLPLRSFLGEDLFVLPFLCEDPANCHNVYAEGLTLSLAFASKLKRGA